MNTLITNSTESAQEEATAETHVGSLSKKTANDLSGNLSGRERPAGAKIPTELLKMEAPRSFRKQTKLKELIEKYQDNEKYIIIYGYYQGFPKYALLAPFVKEWNEMRQEAITQQAEKDKLKPVPPKKLPGDNTVDTTSPYFPEFTRGRRVPRKPNLDQLDGTRD